MSDETETDKPVTTEELAAIERREDGRVRVATEVTMKSVSNFTALGTDLSIGGIYFVAPSQLRDGAVVDLEFDVEGIDETFETVGEVKWTWKHPVGEEQWWGHGVEFHEMESDVQDRLEEFIEERKPLEEIGSLPPLEKT